MLGWTPTIAAPVPKFSARPPKLQAALLRDLFGTAANGAHHNGLPDVQVSIKLRQVSVARDGGVESVMHECHNAAKKRPSHRWLAFMVVNNW